MITLPISTTNMTGFPIMLRGFSLTRESKSARRTIFMSQMAFDFFFSAIVSSESLADCISRCSRIGPRLSAGKNVKRTHNQNHADQQHAEQRRGHRKCAQRRRNIFLSAPDCRQSPAWE